MEVPVRVSASRDRDERPSVLVEIGVDAWCYLSIAEARVLVRKINGVIIVAEKALRADLVD